MQDQNFQEAMRQATQASKDISHTTTDENTKRLATGVSGSYEQSMSQRNEAAKSFRQADDYSNQASFTKANSATINYNANQQFGEWLANQPADNTNGRIGVHGAMHIMAANPGQTMAYAQRYMAEQGMIPTNSVSSANHLKSSYDQEQRHQVYAVTRDSLKTVTQEAGNMEPAMNSQVANDVSGNANSGTIDMTMTSNHIAASPRESVGYAAQQLADNHLASKSSTMASSEQGKVSYNQEQERQVTRDSINATAKESTNMETAMSSQTIINQVEGTMASNRTEIDAQANQVQSRGDTITGKVKKNQNKGVNYRAAAKGVKEVGNIVKDIKNIKFGESQQK